jgi:hypothetical protein
VPERSGFATTTIGPPFWGERLGAKLATLRLARQPRTEIANALEGTVHVRGTVRAIGDAVAGPLSGRPSVFGRLLACFEQRRPSERTLGADRYVLLTQADVTFGGGFALEDESGRGRIEVRAEDPFELFVLVRRAGAWNREEALPRLRAFSRVRSDAPLALEDERMVYGEWAIEEGQTLSVIGDVVGLDAAPDDRDYRGMRRLPVLGPRKDRPILFFE